MGRGLEMDTTLSQKMAALLGLQSNFHKAEQKTSGKKLEAT